MFNAFNALVEKATVTAKQCVDDGYDWIKQTGIMDLDEEFNDENVEKSAQCEDERSSAEPQSVEISEADPQVTKNLIFGLPVNWESPPEEWRTLSDAALKEENGSIIPPSTVTSDTELSNKICDLIGIESVDALPLVPEKHVCVPTTELVDLLSSSPDFIRFRSRVVPLYVSDEQYWINIWWRFQLYHKCKNSFQLIDVMDTVTTEPNPFDKTGDQRRKGVGVPDSTLYWMKLKDSITENRARNERVADLFKTLHNEIEVIVQNLQLVTNIINKGEKNELSESVFGSCAYHKKKISQLMDNLKAQEKEIEASNSPTSFSSMMQRLLVLDEELQSGMEAYTALSSGNLSKAREIISHTENEDEESSARRFSLTGKTDEAVFEAALPWEQDIEFKEATKEEESV